MQPVPHHDRSVARVARVVRTVARSTGFHASMLALLGVATLAGCASLLGADFDVGTRDPESSDGNPDGTDGSTTNGGSGSGSGSSGGRGDGSAEDGATATDSGGTSSSQCHGTPAACSGLVGSACSAQAGCTLTATKCTLTSDCAGAPTTTQCNARAGCEVYPPGPVYCVAVPGYCSGSTRNACEANDGCAFSGGCSGTPSSCKSFADEASCTAQAGCAW